ncbi:MAG: hypothetical protein IPG71_10855 [bacterium]|nr:hypothetical protein [bacterium]
MRASRVLSLGRQLFAATLLVVAMSPDSTACSECVCFTDANCSANTCDGDLTANCERTIFHPSCTGSYQFKAMTECGGTSLCYDCRSCANIFQLDGANEVYVANCHTHECDVRDCETVCSVTLDSTKTYVVYVCKIPCPGGPTCDDCGEECKAYACLSCGSRPYPCKP